ncbi:SpaA isopeptide-forming pilin-related protein, partial [Leuconostoc sp. UCMA20149]|uniref:SpaA isopeptide-forming pilin-related protein n=1 Tax=Leuconostoc sp. UCMA20149 TaxID=2583528 RepID=UPI0025B27701
MQRLFSRQMPLVMLTILFLQFLSSFASVYAVATPNTSSIITLTQKESKVDVSISVAALDDHETKDTLVITNSQLIDVPDSGDITATDSNKTIATYQKSSSDTLTITRLTDKVTAGDLKFAIKQSGTVGFKLNNDEKKTVAVKVNDKNSVTGATSSISKDDVTTANSTKSNKSLQASAPTDISNYLPDDVKGTIIDSANLVFTDANGKTVDPSDVTSNTNIKLEYNWSIPNDLKDNYQLKNGDYFTFYLPKGIQYKASNGSLGDYGTYQITSDGKVTFTFNDKVESKEDISGTFNYNATISSETTTGTHVIVIPTKDVPKDTTIIVNPTGGNDISKSGKLTGENHSKNATGITWDVDINTNMQELSNATVTDPMPKSTDGKVTTTLKSTTVYPLIVDLKGNVTGKGAALVEGKDYTVDLSGKVTFIGDYAKTNSAFRIEYTSDIDASTLPEDGGSVTFKNRATLNNGDKTATADASVTANYGKLLEKVYDGQDNNGSQKYNWHINYNFGEEKLSADKATLVDNLSDGQVFPADSRPVLTYEDGSVVSESAYQVSYNGSRTAMTIKFTNGLDQGVKIAYQSQVTAPIDGNEKVTISNEVTSGDKKADSGTHDVGQQGLTKSLGSVDYNGKTVTWNFDINMARQNMSNWSMSDTVPDGLTVIESSFVLKSKDKNITYTNGTDYKVVMTAEGFTVEFLGDLKNSAPDWYTLSYKTAFDTNKLNGKWTNTAKATWTDKYGKEHINKGSADFTPKAEFKNDGSKSGAYNAVNKHITWTVVGNYNQRELKSATIVDPIPDGQVYVDGSAKLYEATINTNGSYTLGSEVTDAHITLNSDKTKIQAFLPEGSNKVYVLIFDTSLDGTVINQSPYTNTATYSNDSKTRNLDAKVSVPNSGSLVTKNGQQDTSDSAYAKYNMWVNKSQSTLKNVVVDDTPSVNQIIDEQSIVINETTVDKNGNFTENTSAPLTLNKDYKVELTTDPSTGKQELKISFINQISKAYVINYRSLINSSKSNDTLNNSVTITGDNEKSYTETKTTNTNVVNNGGSANGKNLNLVISKTDADTKKALPGATFELYSDVKGQKGQLLRSGTTSADGQLAWNNLKSGKYVLVETSAPDGYNIASDYAQGKEISLTYSDKAVDANNNFTLNVANEEKTGSVVLTKTDSDTNKILAGATFSLYKSDGTKVASDLTTDVKGQISKDGLKPGDYYFVETAAPAGYDLNKDKQYKFTIAFQDIESAGKVVKVSATNAEKTGSVVLTKKDSDSNKVLAGATFDLYKADGTKVATDLTTNADGQINEDGLKPGDYYFVETAAPAGYNFDKDKHYDFTVELQTTAKVATVS